MSLCTYCHAPPAPGTQAEFDLSPLFRGARNAGRISAADKKAGRLRSGRLMAALPPEAVRKRISAKVRDVPLLELRERHGLFDDSVGGGVAVGDFTDYQAATAK